LISIAEIADHGQRPDAFGRRRKTVPDRPAGARARRLARLQALRAPRRRDVPQGSAGAAADLGRHTALRARSRVCLSALRRTDPLPRPVQIRMHIYGWQVGAPLVCAGKIGCPWLQIGCPWLLEYRASWSKRLIRRGMTSNPVQVSEPSTSMGAGSGSRMPVAGEKPVGSLEEVVGRSAAPLHSVALRRGYP
jgi:hypothetical protein